MDGQGTAHAFAGSWGVNNPLLGRHLAKWSMLLIMAFPIVDFALRLHPVHPLGVIWDKVVLLILIGLVVARWMSGHRPTWLRWQKYAGWYMLYGLALMFAGMNSPITAVQGYRIDVYYILFAFLIPLVVDPEDVKTLFHVGATVAILIGVHGIYQYIVKAPIPTDWVDPSQHVRTRVYSVLQSPNELGSYMALMTPIIVGLAVAETDRLRKWMYGAGAVVCACTLVFTFTRGAWVSLAAAAFIVALLFERRLLVGLIVLGIVGYFLPPIHHRIDELFSPVYWLKSATGGGRISKWLTAFDRMSTNPLFGVGLGHYGGAVSSIYLNGAYSDNYYAKTLGETGLVGLTLFIAMHLALIRDLFQRVVKRSAGRQRYIALGGFTGLLAVLFHNGIENVFEFGPMAISYFTYASLFFVWAMGFSKEAAHETNNAPLG